MRITAQPNTSPAAIINKVAETAEKEISLFLPEDSVFFADLENFRLLKRQAESQGKRVTIVTPDASGRNKAQEIGFKAVSPQEDDSFFASLEQALNKQEPEPALTDAGKKGDQAAANTVSRFRQSSSRIGRRPLRWLVVLALGLGLLTWVVFFLPFAQVTIYTQREPVEFTLSATLDTKLSQVNIDERKIPAQVVEAKKEISLVSESTGFKDFNQKAQGSIVVYNEQDFEQPMIPSRFQSENGNIYWSQRNILIPPRHKEDGQMVPGTLQIEVVADGAGPDYNLNCSEQNSCRFTIPAWKGTDKFEKVYARATTPLLGGEAGESKVVTESDLKVAGQVIQEKGRKEAMDALQSSTPEGFRLVKDSLEFEIGQITFDKSAGQIGDTFTATGQLSAKAFIINQATLSDFIDTLVKARIEPGKRTFPETIEANFSTEAKSFQEGTASVNLVIKEEAGWEIDSQALKSKLAGKSLPEARRILLQEDKIDSAQVRLGPTGAFWVSTIPGRQSQISITVK